jgi:hypothetical protein
MEREMLKQLLVSASAALLVLPVMALEALPKDVEQFITKREGCDHFRGEIPEPGQKKRMREVSREIKRLCTGTDKALSQLKMKYDKDKAVLQRLDDRAGY